MKHSALIVPLLISATSVAMENQLQISNRHLDTCKRPCITIINKLSQSDNLLTTRIDVSDPAEIKKYIHNSYQPDVTTKTIYANHEVHFFPETHTWMPEHKRFGLNDKEDTAIIAVYIHGDLTREATKPINYFVIGKGSLIQFKDTITFTTNSPNKDILVIHKDNVLQGIGSAIFPYVFGIPASETDKHIVRLTKYNEKILRKILITNPIK